MAFFLKSLRERSAIYEIEETSVGFTLIRRGEHHELFNDLASRVINAPQSDFVVFPTTDGNDGYDRLVIVPLDGPSGTA